MRIPTLSASVQASQSEEIKPNQSAEAAANEDSGDLEPVDEVDEIGGADESQDSSSGEPAQTASDEKDVEDQTEESELPSLESVEGAFAAPEEIEAVSGQGAASIDVMGTTEDPAIVAKAVRTFMNKDQEG